MSARLEVAPYRLPFARALVTAAGTHRVRVGYLVRLVVDGPRGRPDAHTGYGEAAPLPGHGGETLADCRAGLAALAAGVDALDPDAVATPSDLAARAPRLIAAAPDAPCARAAVDLALADRAARRAARPLARWLSGGDTGDAPRAAGRLAVNATIGALPAAAAADRARAAVRVGFGTLKIKIGDADPPGADPNPAGRADVARVAAVRAAVGPAVRLRADANGAWDVDTAAGVLAALASYDLEYVEQPVAAGDIAGLAALRRAGAVRVAADEALERPGGLAAVLGAGAADVLVLKPALIGGPTAALAAARAADEAGAAVVFTSALDSAVGRTAALHVAAARPGRPHADGLATGDWLAHDLAPGPTAVGGWIRLPEGPGLGLEPEPGGAAEGMVALAWEPA